jgi:flagellar protein FliS
MLTGMSDPRTDSQAFRAYTESRVLMAPPVEVVHMLYQVATDNLNIAIACLESGDNMARARAVTKAQEAIHELTAGLDPTVSENLCRNVADLYDYVQRQIVMGHTRRLKQSFEDALAVLNTLAEGWSGVRASVMGQNTDVPDSPPDGTEPAAEKQISRLFAEFPQQTVTSGEWSG